MGCERLSSSQTLGSGAYVAPVAPEELLTTGETAKRLGLSRSTLWRYVKAGLIEPDLITAGGHFRFDPEHVRRQLRALQQRGDS